MAVNKEMPYKLSRDYKRLRELLDAGYRVICYADYIYYSGLVKKTLIDICTAKRWDERYMIGGRGIEYMSCRIKVDEDDFKYLCKQSGIKFIDIE